MSNRFGDKKNRRAAPARRFGDPELGRFRLDEPDAALESLSAINAHQHRWQYTRLEYLEMACAVRAAVINFYGITPELRDPDELDDFDADDDIDDDGNSESDPDDDGGDDGDDENLRDRTPYSAAYFTMLGKPRHGELEQRQGSWWPPSTPADRRLNR